MGGYSIFHTIDVLADQGFWFLVILLVCWSIIFPFVKLIWLVLLLTRPKESSTSYCVAKGICCMPFMRPYCSCNQVMWLGQMGRWSLLDIVFVVLLLMILCNEEELMDVGPFSFGITGTIAEGLFIFPAAILCSLSAVAIVELHIEPVRFEKLKPSTPEEEPLSLMKRAPKRESAIACFAALAGLILVPLSYFLPLLTVGKLLILQGLNITEGAEEVVEDLLRPNTWSLWSGMLELTREQGPLMGLFAAGIFLFLFLIPLAVHGVILYLMLVPRFGISHASNRLALFLSTLSVIEVEWIGILIYLSQCETTFVSIDLGPAFWCMTVLMFTMPIALVYADKSVKAAAASKEQAEEEEKLAREAAELEEAEAAAAAEREAVGGEYLG